MLSLPELAEKWQKAPGVWHTPPYLCLGFSRSQPPSDQPLYNPRKAYLSKEKRDEIAREDKEQVC